MAKLSDNERLQGVISRTQIFKSCRIYLPTPKKMTSSIEEKPACSQDKSAQPHVAGEQSLSRPRPPRDQPPPPPQKRRAAGAQRALEPLMQGSLRAARAGTSACAAAGAPGRGHGRAATGTVAGQEVPGGYIPI